MVAGSGAGRAKQPNTTPRSHWFAGSWACASAHEPGYPAKSAETGPS